MPAQPPTADADCDVVVMYARADRTWARATLIALLEQRAVHVCAEELAPELDQPRRLALEKLVSTGHYIAPVLTPRFPAGGFAVMELALARRLPPTQDTTGVIPIVREHCEMPISLQMLVSLDMTRDDDAAPAVDRLARALHRPPPASQ